MLGSRFTSWFARNNERIDSDNPVEPARGRFVLALRGSSAETARLLRHHGSWR